MDINIENYEWEIFTYEEKKQLLLIKQKRSLDMYLERNAITKELYYNLFKFFIMSPRGIN